nr:hypothetical protein CFP56_09283 [Quercus suber]
MVLELPNEGRLQYRIIGLAGPVHLSACPADNTNHTKHAKLAEDATRYSGFLLEIQRNHDIRVIVNICELMTIFWYDM